MSAIGSSFRNLRAWRQVMRDAKLSPVELDRVVHQRLERVLISAFLHVPYYREIMQSVGYDPGRDYQGPGDLSRLPVTTQKDLKEREVTAFVKEGSDLSRCYTETTTGSTGTPLRVYRASYEQSLHISKWLRVLFRNGYSPRDKVMAITALTRPGEGRNLAQRFGFLRRLAVDSRRTSPREMVDTLIDYRPGVLYGNRSFLELMALELKRRHKRITSLKLLVATGEVIDQGTRTFLGEHFGVDVVENYGSTELGVMAYETPERDGLVLCDDLTFFEFLDKAGMLVPAGESGRVVVTDLVGTRMPFIRYDQGDLAVFRHGPLVHGRRSRRLTQILGRDSDFAVLPDGTRRLDYHFVAVIKQYESIVQFRVVQRTRSCFRISIVADPSYFEAIYDDLIFSLQSSFPPSVRFELKRVESLEPDPSGKLRRLISDVRA